MCPQSVPLTQKPGRTVLKTSQVRDDSCIVHILRVYQISHFNSLKKFIRVIFPPASFQVKISHDLHTALFRLTCSEGCKQVVLKRHVEKSIIFPTHSLVICYSKSHACSKSRFTSFLHLVPETHKIKCI